MQEITVKITAPNTQYNGVSAGLTFNNGVAEISHLELKDSVKEYLQEKGYEISGLQEAEIIEKPKRTKK